MKMSAIMEEKTLVNLELVKAFRIWQRSLLDRYLDLLHKRMRDTKRSVLVQRFKLI